MAQRRASSGGALESLEADVTTVSLAERFDLVIVALNSVLLLDGRDAQRDLFATVSRHLAPRGRAVIDVWLPSPDDLAVYDGRLVLDWVRNDAQTGRHVAKQTAARYESAARTAQVTTIFDDSKWRTSRAITKWASSPVTVTES